MTDKPTPPAQAMTPTPPPERCPCSGTGLMHAQHTGMRGFVAFASGMKVYCYCEAGRQRKATDCAGTGQRKEKTE